MDGTPRIALETPVQYLKGVGPARARALAVAGVATVEDLLSRPPFRYEDRARVVAVAALVAGETATLRVRACSARLVRTRRPGFTILEAEVEDASGRLKLVCFNRPYLADELTPGRELWLHGAVEGGGGSWPEMHNPEIELGGSEETLHVGRIVPVHERIGSLDPRRLRTLIHRVLAGVDGAPEFLPAEVVARQRLVDRLAAFRELHFPRTTSLDALVSRRSEAWRRLIFEEFFVEQVGLGLSRERARRAGGAAVIPTSVELRERLKAMLPFRLTAAQRRAFKHIVDDLGRETPMRRLLQGDVGSGKTIVAALSMAMVAHTGRQAALMAPTEILAEQHARTLEKLFARIGLDVVLLSGGVKRAELKRRRERLATGEVKIAVGTHALVQEGVLFQDLALAVIDEQHRFGVADRLSLGAKGANPHLLVMTATPIPRSLAIVVYGDLDLAVIDELPPGRRPVRTVLKTGVREAEVYAFVAGEVRAGRQAYVVCPLVEESEKTDLRAAEAWAERLGSHELHGLKLALVHGRMAAAERAAAMDAFARGEVQVLVATTVIEVGLDVANAAVMVIEHAERFGLAQLHQLRGRVGRGLHPSTCILMVRSRAGAEAKRRLETIRDTEDGFRIAQVDLELRGPGEVAGTRQWGAPRFRIGNVLSDLDLLEAARDEARRLLAKPEFVAGAEAAALLARFHRDMAVVPPGEGG